jgi:hypothetical protein
MDKTSKIALYSIAATALFTGLGMYDNYNIQNKNPYAKEYQTHKIVERKLMHLENELSQLYTRTNNPHNQAQKHEKIEELEEKYCGLVELEYQLAIPATQVKQELESSAKVYFSLTFLGMLGFGYAAQKKQESQFKIN